MEFIEKMREIQIHICEYLDNTDDADQNFEDLSSLLTFQQNQPDIQELKSILYIISKISKNHHRGPFFIEKIKKIIIHLKKAIKQSFSNIEIFDFFKKNKLILLFLIEEGILEFDSTISSQISKYKDYFLPEISKFNATQNSIEIPENYEEKRHKGENDSCLCEIIRNDDIDEFIIYYSKTNFSLSKTIEPSIYETNSFLEDKNPTLIEYSTFFGSIQIVRFLFQNSVILSPSLWIYAIHAQNAEIIHFLEENKVHPKDISFLECLTESIKCHHNDLAMYIKENLLEKFDNHSNYSEIEIFSAFEYHNFQFIPTKNNEKYFFYCAVKYDYFKLVEYYRNIEGLNINEPIIHELFFKIISKQNIF